MEYDTDITMPSERNHLYDKGCYFVSRKILRSLMIFHSNNQPKLNVIRKNMNHILSNINNVLVIKLVC